MAAFSLHLVHVGLSLSLEGVESINLAVDNLSWSRESGGSEEGNDDGGELHFDCWGWKVGILEKNGSWFGKGVLVGRECSREAVVCCCDDSISTVIEVLLIHLEARRLCQVFAS